MTARPLPAEQLRARLPAAPLALPAAEAVPNGRMNGQERAQEAIAFGLGIDAEGYNIVVSGLSSSGRTTAVRRQVTAVASTRSPASDWCYFYNFENPYLPRAAALPAGSGVALQNDLARLIDACSTEIPKAFEDETYQERSAAVLQPIGTRREALLEEMQRSAAAQGYQVNVTPVGFVAAPVGQDGRPLSPEVLSSLPNELRATIEHRGEAVEQAVTAAVRELRKLDGEARAALEALDQEVTRFVVGHHFEALRERYGQYGLADHFDAIERDILQNIDSYKRFTQTALQQLPAQLLAQATEERAMLLRRYGVNVLVSQPTPAAGAPVIEERSPTYFNLFGRIDYVAHFGTLTTDFTQIRPGAVHRANGGYLILQAEELLTDGRAWLMLKRCLKTHEVRVEGLGDLMMPFPAVNVVPRLPVTEHPLQL